MIVLLTGPSGAGKSTVIRRVMAADARLAFSVSTTTRPQRPGETDGVEYDFVTTEIFRQLVSEEAFVEWAEVHGNLYGTRHRRLEELAATGKIPVLDVDVQGGVNVIGLYGEQHLVSVFLFPPSWAGLAERLRLRGTDTEEVIERRLANARHEVGFADRYQYWLVNDGLDDTVQRLSAIITAEGCRRDAYTGPPLT